MLGNIKAWLQQLFDGLFLDLPWVLDSALRHADFHANTRYVLQPDDRGHAWKWRAPIAMAVPLAAVLVFALYGPTFNALCSVFPPPYTPYFLWVSAVALLALTLRWAWRIADDAREHYRSRLARVKKQGVTPSRARRILLFMAVTALTLVPLLPLAAAAVAMALAAGDPTVCHAVVFHGSALLQLIAALLLAGLALAAPGLLPRWMLWTPVCVVLSLLALILLWWLAAPDNTEAMHLPYRTLFAVLAAVLFLVVFPARKGVDWIIGNLAAQQIDDDLTFNQALTRALRRCELFSDRDEPRLEGERVPYALLSAPLFHPLLLLLAPSYVALLATHNHLWPLFLSALGIAWLLLALGSISSRWDQQIVLIRRWLLRGLPLLVSVFVIVLALSRLAGIEYVSYVMDATNFGALTLGILMCYALTWSIEGCLHRPLQVYLLAMLADKEWAGKIHDLSEGHVPYPIEPKYLTTQIAAEDRWLQPHGNGRFAVVGRCQPTLDKAGFHIYAEYELFERLVNNEQAFVSSNVDTPDTLSVAAYARLVDRLHELRRRLNLYFTLANALVVLVLGSVIVCAMQADWSLRREPVAKVSAPSPQAKNELTHYDLLAQLHAHADRPALLIAASGGGSRAALFATAAVQGLARAGHAQDIRLLSGVSGGGVSLTYFAAHRSELSQQPMNVEAWSRYFDAMEYNHIGAVLDGSGEWRLLRKQSLAHLLVASFDAQFGKMQATHFGELRQTGLILNTTITGHPYQDSSWLRALLFEPDGRPARATPHAAQDYMYSRLAGGRLVFTNLANITAFPQQGSGHGDPNDLAADLDLTYKVITDPSLPLTTAAALNANFPPVFANSGVWLYANAEHCCLRAKYYVTDGGINENRGLISLLYAVDGALIEQLKVPAAQRQPLPPLDIVVVEASATGFAYSQDRGIGAVLSSGAKERLASGVERLLIERVCMHAQQLDGECAAPQQPRKPGNGPTVRVHYLMMPAVFVTRGGLGTHWMLPNTITLTDPRTPQAGSDSIDLNKLQASQLIQCLFQSQAHADPALGQPGQQVDCELVLAQSKLPDDWLVDTEPCMAARATHCVIGWRALRQTLAGADSP